MIETQLAQYLEASVAMKLLTFEVVLLRLRKKAAAVLWMAAAALADVE